MEEEPRQEFSGLSKLRLTEIEFEEDQFTGNARREGAMEKKSSRTLNSRITEYVVEY